MNLILIKRRQEMLDLHSKGIPLPKIIDQLAAEYGVSKRALWNDWMRRKTWVEAIVGLERCGSFADVLELNIKALLAAAWRTHYNAVNENAQIGSLNCLRNILKDQSCTFTDRQDREDVEERLERLEEQFKKKRLKVQKD